MNKNNLLCSAGQSGWLKSNHYFVLRVAQLKAPTWTIAIPNSNPNSFSWYQPYGSIWLKWLKGSFKRIESLSNARQVGQSRMTFVLKTSIRPSENMTRKQRDSLKPAPTKRRFHCLIGHELWLSNLPEQLRSKALIQPDPDKKAAPWSTVLQIRILICNELLIWSFLFWHFQFGYPFAVQCIRMDSNFRKSPRSLCTKIGSLPIWRAPLMI